MTVGDDSGPGPTDRYEDPFGRPDELPEEGEVPPEIRAKVDDVDRLLDETGGRQ